MLVAFPFGCSSQVYFTVPPTGKTCCLPTWNGLLGALLCQCVLYSLLELKMTKQVRSMLPSQSATELDGSCHSWHGTYLQTHLYQQLQYRKRAAGCQGYIWKLLKAVLCSFKWRPWSKLSKEKTKPNQNTHFGFLQFLLKIPENSDSFASWNEKYFNSKEEHRPQSGICATLIQHRHHWDLYFHFTSSPLPTTWWWKPLIPILIIATETL